MTNSLNPTPMPILASRTRWRISDSESIPVLSITNGRGRMFVDSSDFPKIVDAMTAVLEAQGVAS